MSALHLVTDWPVDHVAAAVVTPAGAEPIGDVNPVHQPGRFLLLFTFALPAQIRADCDARQLHRRKVGFAAKRREEGVEPVLGEPVDRQIESIDVVFDRHLDQVEVRKRAFAQRLAERVSANRRLQARAAAAEARRARIRDTWN